VVVIEGDYPVISCNESEDLSNNYVNATWSNKYLESTTVNSKTVVGEWVRPDTVVSNYVKKFESNI
jgi:hypothetical protein